MHLNAVVTVYVASVADLLNGVADGAELMMRLGQ